MNTAARIATLSFLVLPLLGAPQHSLAQDDVRAKTRIVGGTASTTNAFPWLVALVQPVAMGGAHIGCGASLIAPRWVLTAAHCMFDPDTGVMETTATVEALLNTNNTTAGGVRIPITQIIIHDNYDNVNDPDVKNDIALLQLGRDASQITVPLVTPATEALANPGTTAIVAGWGGTDGTENAPQSPMTLLQVGVSVSTDAACNTATNNNAATQLCAGGVANQDACPGDSGGPLVVPNGTGQFALAGVVSRASNLAVSSCGDANIPGVYTRVSRFNDWILPRIAGGTATGLGAAVLPTSRSVRVGQAGTAFATIVNAGTTQATGCRILGPTGLGQAMFSFNTTNPATNVPNGTADASFNIAAGGLQTLVLSLTSTQVLPSTQLQLGFDCDSTDPAGTITGLTTLLFSASATATPDVIALAATAGSVDGVVDLPGAAGASAFAVATANVGSEGVITVSANTGQATLPVTLLVCETTNATPVGSCLAPAAATVTTTIAANATPTFSIFALGTGTVAPDFANNRIFVDFAEAGGTVRGGTSVGVQTIQ